MKKPMIFFILSVFFNICSMDVNVGINKQKPLRNITKIECPLGFCKKYFNNHSNLVYHLQSKKHLNNQILPPFKCDLCNKIMKRSDSFKAHLKNFHQLTDMQLEKIIRKNPSFLTYVQIRQIAKNLIEDFNRNPNKRKPALHSTKIDNNMQATSDFMNTSDSDELAARMIHNLKSTASS